ncbi:hypothetical protein [Caulobacter sp.]|uniref:hypothetical protein n=1 Tax=Caulobacter sp. TaxID=78 RepID=UPI003BAF0D82
MTSRFRGLIAGACALAISMLSLSPALAADNYTVKDSTGTTRTMKAKEVSGALATTHTVADSAGALIDPSTSGKQDTGNTSLGSIDTKLSSQATATKQDTGNASLSSIDTKATSTNTKLDSLITAVGTPASATKQDTGNASLSSIDGKATSTNTKLDTLHTDLTAATPAGTNVIGDVGSASFSVTCSTLTLPGTGGTYASGDLVANSATAGAVVAVTCPNVARFTGGPVTITKAVVLTSTTGVANASFRLHEYTAVPTVTNGNDGVFLSTASGHFCRVDVTVDQVFSNGATGSGAPISNATCTRVLSGTRDISLLVEARGAYAWTAAQTLIITLEGFN